MTELVERGTGIKYLSVENRENGYIYYLVDIRKKGRIRYKKYFKFNFKGLDEAVKYIENTLIFIEGSEI